MDAIEYWRINQSKIMWGSWLQNFTAVEFDYK